MIDPLFARLTLADLHRDLIRNIVSVESAQNPFEDLSSDADNWLLAQQVEDAVSPPPPQS